MKRNEIGKVRQSTLIMNYGPGAIIDFRVPSTGAAVSVISSGLEQWERKAREANLSLADLRRFREQRLSQKLKVQYFRQPPVHVEDEENNNISVVGIRFPRWLQCPECDLLKPSNKWASDPGDPSRFCTTCSAMLPGKEKVYVVPVRFVVACRNGHLDDFPWNDWVHEGKSCSNLNKFYLKTTGPGLAGLELSCPKCKNKRTLEHIFSKNAHKNRKCTGARLWLTEKHEECNQRPITVQRGASNLYFPIIESALAIPPWSDDIINSLGHWWDQLKNVESSKKHNYIDIVWDQLTEFIPNIDKEEFKKIIDEKLIETEKQSSGNLRWDEYKQFVITKSNNSPKTDFEIRRESEFEISEIDHLLRIVSLKEVRALRSFTRIEPAPGNPKVRYQYLSKTNLGWLPAIEVKGEGIFIGFNHKKIKAWESNPKVLDRANRILNYDESRVLNPDGEDIDINKKLGARYLLLHSLSHILMKQLSLQCGYSSASLRERLYLGEVNHEMSGILIYTATSDSDGTLGGLQRQGKSRKFEELFMEAIRANEWCSSDPLCINELVSASESSSLSACHSCLLAPETSCEDYNRFLDRGMIYGSPDHPEIGFFSEYLNSYGNNIS